MAIQKTILHIEDNFDNRRLVRKILQANGYEVFDAENAEIALELIKHHKPDMILMDINMPGTDGYTLTSEIKSLPQYCHIPILAITANAMKGDRERSINAGCDAYIEKPIDIDHFLEQVKRFLEK